MATLATVKLLLWIFAAWCRRVANQIDREHPPPHYPGTLGEAWANFAEQLRRFADDLAW